MAELSDTADEPIFDGIFDTAYELDEFEEEIQQICREKDAVSYIQPEHWRVIPRVALSRYGQSVRGIWTSSGNKAIRISSLASALNTTHDVATEVVSSPLIKDILQENNDVPLLCPHCVILLPHSRSQAKTSEVKKSSRYPVELFRHLIFQGYSVSLFRDATVTRDIWLDSLHSSPSIFYVQGHGFILEDRNEFRMYTGDKFPSEYPHVRNYSLDYNYIGANFIRQSEAQLTNTLVYIFSCDSFFPDMISAFESLGAVAYVGWTKGAPHRQPLADDYDRFFWASLSQGDSVNSAISKMRQLGKLPWIFRRKKDGEKVVADMNLWGDWQFS